MRLPNCSGLVKNGLKYSKWDLEVLDVKRFKFVLFKRPYLVPPRVL